MQESIIIKNAGALAMITNAGTIAEQRCLHDHECVQSNTRLKIASSPVTITISDSATMIDYKEEFG
jgi:hypothetical protein